VFDEDETTLVVDADDADPDYDEIVVEQRADAPPPDPEDLPTAALEAELHPLPDFPPEDPVADVLEPATEPAPEPQPQLEAPASRYQLRSRVHIDKEQHEQDKAIGERQRRHWDDDAKAYVLTLTVKQALRDPKLARDAEVAIDTELRQMLKMDVFKPLFKHQLPSFKKPIRSKMFLKEKYNSQGLYDKLRARLVSGGHQQSRREVLHEDITSPTAAIPFLFAVATIAAAEKREVVTADVPVAYLHADNSAHNITMTLERDIAEALIRIDQTYAQYQLPDGSLVVKLQRALYGCIESARLWYNLLRSILETAGYVVNPLDPCIMNRTVNGVQCTVVIYVDDLMFTCKDHRVIRDTIAQLEARLGSTLKVTEGKVHSYLGITWDFTVPGKCSVTMTGYTADLVKLSGVVGTTDTPAANHLFVTRQDAAALSPDEADQYHTLVAKTLYLSKRTRPDLLLPISFLTTRVLHPDRDDQSKLMRVMRYLNGTPHLGVNLQGWEGTIEAYIDASYGVHADCRSHSGMIVTMGGAPIDAKSVKQTINTKSSAEAELMALSDQCSRVIWCRDFLTHQGYKVPPARVYQDNQSTIAISTKGSAATDRTRHVSIRYFWMKDRVANGDIEVIYKPTTEMVADMLTKPLQGPAFLLLRDKLLNVSC
jgi:hypothetical protein